ncbi:3-phosphoshikimate 1-carboxyvinyltransferase [Coprobacter tertius]|uniref:3-phosphoshikimate 1-carboxyvinyltransferase n=1 Tax=Coprobacter tertius TaxID=2944915 RepID=A0ABT1MG37_9BACT|nr:3-phosphoshikimate 1-carboxyvinyltransferase [Coprobacter tertius]MCP9611587.1 3-phosphoshikimate 1-carboxyvinyltransferase [Coprobacter tertius]
MSILITPPKECRTTINLPASKSISNRALILNALSYSSYPVENLSDCDDTRVMIDAFESNNNKFDIHAAGTAMRFMTAFLSKIVGEWVITGSDRMKQRPIGLLVDALRSLGARIEYLEKDGYPPLKIYGSALKGGSLTLNGNVSSQYISALLMVAPYMEEGLDLTLAGNIISRPYIGMTLKMMKVYGVDAVWNDHMIRVRPGEYRPVRFTVESDWSAASYWCEIASLIPDAEVILTGLQKDSVQGDSRIASFFKELGISTQYVSDGVKLFHNGKLAKGLNFDLSDQPDLAQTLVVTCVLKGVHFRFSGLQSLKIKETDRIEALKVELHKLGFVIKDINGSVLVWNGERCEPHYSLGIDTYDDHRMAMAFAPASILVNPLMINHPQVVSKSYPGYWNDLKKSGFTIIEK